MDTINPVSGATQLHIPPIATTAATDLSSGPAKQNTTITPSSTGAQAAEADAAFSASISFKNTYAISDHSFSLFKDANGTLITRYVSLRDGTVTYLPEPVVVRQMQASTGDVGGSTGKLLISV